MSEFDPEKPCPAPRAATADAEAEAERVAALRRGENGAFDELVRRHGPKLLAVARRILRDEELARDCVQETFLSAYRAIDRFEERSTLSTWLHRIVTNAALMKLRARRGRPEEPLDGREPMYDRYGFRVGPIRANALTPEELLQRSGTRERVREAIDQLPEGHRTILMLRDLDGFTTREAAELLGISTGAAKVRLHRARTALKESLAPLFEEEA
ncbi:MAG: sigma-70 family RNA polymerase sigma factor [Proteobacteria bacterium]|nr:sigma-70 family RNA polymerase sigma factor [Pseudomonadota bacterium]